MQCHDLAEKKILRMIIKTQCLFLAFFFIFRDKKKLEQSGVETEEDALAEKNAALKQKLSELENEAKTLKKLMTELGLVKTSQVL